MSDKVQKQTMPESEIFGVCIELAQRTPYSHIDLGDDVKKNEEPYFILFSYFDEMRIKLVENTKGYLNNDNVLLPDFDRINAPSETRRIFLYAEAPTEENALKCLISMGTNGSDNGLFRTRPFVALVGIKLFRDFFHITKDTDYTAADFVRSFFKEAHANSEFKFTENKEYFIFHALGPEDVYVLFLAENPEEATKVIYGIRQYAWRIPEEYQSCNEYINWKESYKKQLEDSGKEFDDQLFPVVLQTYTDIGIRAGISTEFIEERVLKQLNTFELQLQLYAGANMDSLQKKIIKKFCKTPKASKWVTFGRFGQIIQGRITVKDLIELYREPFINWRDPEHYIHQVHFTTGRFMTTEKPKPGSLPMPTSMYENATQWLREGSIHTNSGQLNKAKGILEAMEAIKTHQTPKSVGNLEKPEPPSKQDERVKELLTLHMQGVNRLFQTYLWGEFRDVLHFFDHFWDIVLAELREIADMSKNWECFTSEQRTLVQSKHEQVMEGINVFYERMSVVLNDRLVLGMPMHENMRPGIYAAGAYEDLIQAHRVWLRVLRDLYLALCGLKLKEDRLPFSINYDCCVAHFLLVPTRTSDIRSQNLFPLSKNKDMAIVIDIAFADMLELSKNLPILIHELGHYACIYQRTMRVTAFFEMVSFKFVDGLMQEIREFYFPPLQKGIASLPANDLRKCLYLALCEAVKTEESESICLDRAMLIGRQVFNRIMLAFSNNYKALIKNILSGNSEFSINEAGCVRAIAEIYDSFGMLHSVTARSVAFQRVLEAQMIDALAICRDILRECSADLLAIQTLRLNESQVAAMLLSAFKERNEMPVDAARADCMTSNDAMRLISGINQAYIHLEKPPKMEVLCIETLRWIKKQIANRKKNPTGDGMDRVFVYAKRILESQPEHPEAVWKNLYVNMQGQYLHEAGYAFLQITQSGGSNVESDSGKDFQEMSTRLLQVRDLYKNIISTSGHDGRGSLRQMKLLLAFMKKWGTVSGFQRSTNGQATP